MKVAYERLFPSLRIRSCRRRTLLAKALSGIESRNLHGLLGTKRERERLSSERDYLHNTWKRCSNDEPEVFVVEKSNVSSVEDDKYSHLSRGDENAGHVVDDEEVESFEDYFQVLKQEEATRSTSVYKGSQTFLKGTQSANPHNDYSQHFVDTDQRPQNFIRDSGLAERFDEYPKLKELIRLKDELVAETATPPMYLQCDLHTYDLHDLGSRFDVIVIEPPLEEYHIPGRDCWSWDQVEQLDIPTVIDNRCFIWLWCGSGPEGLQRGSRQCLRSWGFRRCEDICWVKTNVNSPGSRAPTEPDAIFQRTKEHCLMGIKGTVRRSTDGDFIHANVDIDIIITEEPDSGTLQKPLEITLIAEHFCLGRRRLHLFGRDDTIRPGWLAVGPEFTSSNFDSQLYCSFFEKSPGMTTGCTERIESLRPKSPVLLDKRQRDRQGGSGSVDGAPSSGIGGGGSGSGGSNMAAERRERASVERRCMNRGMLTPSTFAVHRGRGQMARCCNRR